MTGEPISVEYRFGLPDGSSEAVSLSLDAVTLAPLDRLADPLPSWTRLGFEQCPNCPLSLKDAFVCPMAARLAMLTPTSNRLISYEMVDVEVVTVQRTIRARVTAEMAIGSLMGLISAVSGCPHMSFFRPMARFHLPFATLDETYFRAAGSFLLVQYLKQRRGGQADYDLDGLQRIYDRISVVNAAFAERLRAAAKTDSALNAIVRLDFHAQGLSFSLEATLDRLDASLAPFWEAGQL